MRAVLRYEHDAPGAMVHVDVKKLGKIPTGGGWRIHGVGSDEHRASKRKGAGTGRVGYTYLHRAPLRRTSGSTRGPGCAACTS